MSLTGNALEFLFEAVGDDDIVWIERSSIIVDVMLIRMFSHLHSPPFDNFSFYENEDKIKKIVVKKIKGNSEECAKRKRELFHLLVFLELSSDYSKDNYEMREAPDAEIMHNGQKIGVEIAEVFDGAVSYNEFRSRLNSFLSNNNTERFAQGDPNKASAQMEKVFNRKVSKLRKIYSKEYDYNVLLIVTTECKENPEPILKHWYERYCGAEKLRKMDGTFDEVYFLNYGASGKDGGPILMNLKDSITFSEIY